MRPTGVTLSACFQFLRAALVALFAGAAFLVTGLASRVAALNAESNLLQRIISTSGRSIALILLIYAAVQIASGVGLLMLRNWGRLLAIFFSVLGIITLIPKILHHRPFGSLFGLLNLAVLIYLLLPQTRAYFRNKQLPGTTPGGSPSSISTV